MFLSENRFYAVRSPLTKHQLCLISHWCPKSVSVLLTILHSGVSGFSFFNFLPHSRSKVFQDIPVTSQRADRNSRWGERVDFQIIQKFYPTSD